MPLKIFVLFIVQITNAPWNIYFSHDSTILNETSRISNSRFFLIQSGFVFCINIDNFLVDKGNSFRITSIGYVHFVRGYQTYQCSTTCNRLSKKIFAVFSLRFLLNYLFEFAYSVIRSNNFVHFEKSLMQCFVIVSW